MHQVGSFYKISERTLVIYFMCMYLVQHVISIIVFGVLEDSSLRLVKSNMKSFNLTYFRKLKPVVVAWVNSELFQLGEFSWSWTEQLKCNGSFLMGCPLFMYKIGIGECLLRNCMLIDLSSIVATTNHMNSFIQNWTKNRPQSFCRNWSRNEGRTGKFANILNQPLHH
jgi:hypothetical protein